MNNTLLYKARNIHEQQSHNKRMTVLFIALFMIFFLSIGIGFDIFYGISRAKLFFILPLFFLTLVPIIWNFQGKFYSPLESNSQEKTNIDPDLLFAKMIFWVIILLILSYQYYLWNRNIYYGYQHTGVLKVINALIEFYNEPFLRIMPWGTALTIVMIIFLIFSSMQWGPTSIVMSVDNMHFKKYPEQDKLLQNVVEEMSIAAGISAPQTFIIIDTDPNAFAVGTRLDNNCVIVTSGLLTMLNREELQGVIAHEISHIKNNDTQLMTTITVLFGGILLLVEWLRKIIFWNIPIGTKLPGFSFVLKIILFVLWICGVLLAPIIAKILAMSVSRQREYLADANAAELTRNPIALANALAKIDACPDPTHSIPKSISHFCVIDPLGKKVNNKEGFWADLFATHPPIQKRIMFLRSMAYQSPATRK